MSDVPADFQGIPVAYRGGNGPEWLYRFYGEGGLLYVGITRAGIGRFKGHKKEKVWWPFVQRIEVECFSTRSDVRVAECLVIADERPKFNVADRGPFAAVQAEHNERIRSMIEEASRLRGERDRLKRENEELRKMLRGEQLPDWEQLGVEVSGNVIPFVPRHLREPIAA